jgi:hypothetical protein
MAQLDDRIAGAIAQIREARRDQPPDAYIESFRESARGKARDVVDRLREWPASATLRRPVFVSIGGGDGTELAYLLAHSDATQGILVERDRHSADLARRVTVPGKELRVIEADAQEGLAEAMSIAASLVSNGQADFQAVTCHAVIHELYDRSDRGFDPTRFFGTIFGDRTVATWFTYREPGAPEKWPEVVLLKASCAPESLLELARQILGRHRAFQTVGPEPHVLGDHVRMHRNLAMETLVKLFYLDAFAYELEERSTAVDHQQLESILMMAIGDTAVRHGGGMVSSTSAATESFTSRWRELGVVVSGFEMGRELRLPLPESQTRVIAWRVPEVTEPAVNAVPAVHGVEADLILAREAHRSGDTELVTALLISRGRAWIESPSSRDALAFLRILKAESDPLQFLWLWSHYLTSLSELFAGQLNDPDAFSAELEGRADAVELALLFRGERMELFRKLRRPDEAIGIANSLLWLLKRPDPAAAPGSSLQHYVQGTSAFVLNNFLRSGGSYHLALDALDSATAAFQAGTESHAVELAHCHYARNVCAAMTGVSSFTPQYPAHPHRQRFAAALIQLAYSHAAWSLDDVAEAERYALESAAAFESIGTPNYAQRARELAALLKWWKILRSGAVPSWPDDEMGTALRALTGEADAFATFAPWFATLRPSRALGLLQFATGEVRNGALPTELALPRVLYLTTTGELEWRTPPRASTFAVADTILRTALDIPMSRRLPLLAD